MADKPGILRNLRIKRVALVDMGANFDKKTGDGAHIMLWKRADPVDVAKNPSVGAVHVEGVEDYETEYEKANLNAESRNSLPDSAFAAVWTDTDGKKRRKLPIHDAGHLAAARGRIDQADIPANVKAEARRKIEAATNGNKEKSMKKSWKEIAKGLIGLHAETDPTKRAAAAVELAKAAEGMPDDADADDKPADKPVHKADDPMCKCADCMAKSATVKSATDQSIVEINKQMVDMAKANTELQKQLATEIEKRENGEMVVLLKSFVHTSINLDTDVAHFRKMKAADPVAFERTIAIMKASEAQIARGDLYKNAGSSASGSAPAWDKIVAKAKEQIAKGTEKMTIEQSIEKVMLDPDNMGLVREYRNGAQA